MRKDWPVNLGIHDDQSPWVVPPLNPIGLQARLIERRRSSVFSGCKQEQAASLIGRGHRPAAPEPAREDRRSVVYMLSRSQLFRHVANLVHRREAAIRQRRCVFEGCSNTGSNVPQGRPAVTPRGDLIQETLKEIWCQLRKFPVADGGENMLLTKTLQNGPPRRTNSCYG
jgi:hypothetical protein